MIGSIIKSVSQIFSGYSAHSYELLQAPSNSRSSSITPNQDPYYADTCPDGDRKTFELPKGDFDKNVLSSTTGKDTLTLHDAASANLLHAKSSGAIGLSPLQGQKHLQVGNISGPETHSLVLSSKPQEDPTQEDDFLSSLVAPCRLHTKEGKGAFRDLYFPPLPAPDISQVVTPLQSKLSLSQVASNISVLCSSHNALGSVQEDEASSSLSGTNQEAKTSDSETGPTISAATSPSSPGHSLRGSRKKLTGQDSLTKVRKSNSKIMELAKDKFLNTREKYCPTGNVPSM